MADSGIDISETTYGLQVKLSPSGRSNGESDPAQWDYNGVETTFEGFDWSSNGWTGESLKLTGGAKAVIGYRLFKDDAGATRRDHRDGVPRIGGDGPPGRGDQLHGQRQRP